MSVFAGGRGLAMCMWRINLSIPGSQEDSCVHLCHIEGTMWVAVWRGVIGDWAVLVR